ncbi:MAG: hypothetical protein LBR34_07275, partial [Prevotella sp.]|nr:hypothetical protein [Prevotella sp.]
MKKKKSSAIKKIIQVVLLTILMFYHIYPTGFPLFGFSFIFTSGLIGLGLYAYNRFPYSEVASLGALYLMMVCWSLFCTFVNATNDSFIVDYTKSEVGWLFSAYLMIYLFFKIHPDGKPIYVAYYLIAVVALQCIISLMMSQNEAVNDFFNDLQQLNPLEAFKRRQTEGNRLLGYGTAFFGAGVCCGTALILLGYVLMSQKWNFWRLLLIAFLYAGIFYVGLLSARTTMVGGAASAILIVILVFQRRAPLSQLSKFAGLGFMMFSIGYTLCFLYYPEFVDWAFEAFDSYEEYGSFQTDSSNGLAVMFIMPSTMSDWVVGWGIGRFLMSDVGY